MRCQPQTARCRLRLTEVRPLQGRKRNVRPQELQETLSAVRTAMGSPSPLLSLVLGSGWSDAAEFLTPTRSLPYSRIPHFGQPSVPGHNGRLALSSFANCDFLVFHGRRHWYEGDGWDPVALPVRISREFEVPALLLTNAAGGIRDDLEPGALMVVNDHINAMGVNPLVGAALRESGPCFADMSRVYDPLLRGLLDRSAERSRVRLRHGVYAAVSGPSYETPAEVRALQRLGADAVGMSTVPEAVFACALGLRVAALSCIANRASSADRPPLSHEDVLQAGRSAVPSMRLVLREFLTLVAGHEQDIRNQPA